MGTSRRSTWRGAWCESLSVRRARAELMSRRYFIAANPSIERHLYSVPLPSAEYLAALKAGDRPQLPVVLTNTTSRGYHSTSFSPFGGFYVLSYRASLPLSDARFFLIIVRRGTEDPVATTRQSGRQGCVLRHTERRRELITSPQNSSTSSLIMLSLRWSMRSSRKLRSSTRPSRARGSVRSLRPPRAVRLLMRFAQNLTSSSFARLRWTSQVEQSTPFSSKCSSLLPRARNQAHLVATGTAVPLRRKSRRPFRAIGITTSVLRLDTSSSLLILVGRGTRGGSSGCR